MRQTYACVFWIKTRHLSISGEKELPQGNPSFIEKKKKREVKRGFGRLACPLNFW